MLETTETPPTGGFVASSKGEVYHPADSPAARNVPANERRWFATERAARVAGYRPAAYIIEGLEEFEIVDELGRGGTASVYRARDILLGRQVAIKVLHPTASADEESLARFTREARLVANLKHPRVVSIYGVKKLADGGLALVMEYIPGRTLRDLVREEGPLPLDRALEILRDVSEALIAAHGQGIIHRDIKPQNIFLHASTGRALLADFGIAVPLDDTTRITHTGSVIGTPAYMAPEQFEGGALDARSDQYALGLVAWEMLSGRAPWEGESLYNIIRKQREEQLPSLRKLRPDIPKPVSLAVKRALAKEPDERWADVAEFMAALEGKPSRFSWLRRERRAALMSPPPPLKEDEAIAKGSDPFAADPASAPTVRFVPGETPKPAAAPPLVTADPAALETRPATVLGEAAAAAPPPPMIVAGAPPAGPRPAIVPTRRAKSMARRRRRAAAAILCLVFVALASAGTAWHLGWPPIAEPAERLVAPAWERVAEQAERLAMAATREESEQPGGGGLGGAVERSGNGPGGSDGTMDPTSRARTAGSPDVEREWMTRVQPSLPATTITTDESGDSDEADGAAEAEAGAAAAESSNSAAAADSSSAAAESEEEEAEEEAGADEGAVPDLPLVRDGWSLAVGGMHTCTIVAGTLSCWGGNERGQLGPGGGPRTPSPRPIEIDARPSSVSAGSFHTCVLDDQGAAYCWGDNRHGQLGVGTMGPVTGPRRVANRRFAALALGSAHTCGLALDGRAFCWGSDSYGQLGIGGDGSRAVPTAVETRERFVSIAAGWNHTCALNSRGEAFCWGRNNNGQLGDGTVVSRVRPVPVAGGHRFRALTAGSAHTCGLTLEGEVFCWGQGADGRLGDGGSGDSLVPLRLPTSLRFVQVSAGGRHTCGIAEDRSAYCWGQNNYGQLGDASTSARLEPVWVHSEVGFTTVLASGSHTCALGTDGQRYCWGYNIEGQLGDGTLVHRTVPTPVEPIPGG